MRGKFSPTGRLGGPAPTPVERLLVERVVATWLQLNYFDSVEPLAINADESPRLAQYRARRQQQAHVAHLSALAALTTLRRLLPAPAVEIVAAPTKGANDVPGQNGRGGNGHAAKSAASLPPSIQDRLAGLFSGIDTDEPAAAAGAGARGGRELIDMPTGKEPERWRHCPIASVH